MQYYAGHEFFLDGSNAVIVLIVRLDTLAESETQILYWLRFLKSRIALQPAPDSRPTIILVGSNRDAVKDTEVMFKNKEGVSVSNWGQLLLKKVRSLCNSSDSSNTHSFIH